MGGRLYDDETIEKRVKREASGMKSDDPELLTFVMTYGDESVGRISIKPLCSGDVHAPILGYAVKEACSGKGIAKASMKCLLNIMQRMVDNKDKRYSFTQLKATVAPENKASNAILSSLGFKKGSKTITNRYGKRNLYTYTFKVKDGNKNKYRKKQYNKPYHR